MPSAHEIAHEMFTEKKPPFYGRLNLLFGLLKIFDAHPENLFVFR